LYKAVIFAYQFGLLIFSSFSRTSQFAEAHAHVLCQLAKLSENEELISRLGLFLDKIDKSDE